MSKTTWEIRAELELKETKKEYNTIKNRSVLSPKKLWQLREVNFNKWISDNYYLGVVDFFIQNFNKFETWMKIWKFSKKDLIGFGISNCVEPNRNKKKDYKYIIEVKRNGTISKFVSDYNLDNKKTHKGPYFSAEYTKVSSFVPYLQWVKFQSTKAHKLITNNNLLTYPETQNYGTPHEIITILNGLELIKMGGLTLPLIRSKLLNVKSFEFVNLTYLTIDGDVFTQNKPVRITNSFVNNLTIKNSQLAFFTFRNCRLNNLQITDSTIEMWKFINCKITGSITGSTLLNVSFEDGSFSAPISDCRLYNVDLDINKASHHLSSEGYKILKIAYNNQGVDKKASEYYIKEMEIGRMNVLHSYTASCLSLIKKIVKKKISLSLRMKSLLRLIINQSKLAPYVFKTVNFHFWEYGRNPKRVLGISGIIILLFATFYQIQISGWNLECWNIHNLKNATLISLSSFSTLGFFPENMASITHGPLIIESVLGAVCIAAFIGSVANQKY